MISITPNGQICSSDNKSGNSFKKVFLAQTKTCNDQKLIFVLFAMAINYVWTNEFRFDPVTELLL